MKFTRNETVMRKLAAAYMAPQLLKRASLQDKLAAYGIGLEKRAADSIPESTASAGDYFVQQEQRRNAEDNSSSFKAPEQPANQPTGTTGTEADVDWRNSPYANTLNMVSGTPLSHFNNTGRWNDYRPGELPWQNAALANAQSMAEKSTPFGSSPAVRRAAGLVARETLKQQEAQNQWFDQGNSMWKTTPAGTMQANPSFLSYLRAYREPGLDKLRNPALPAGYATPAS